MQAQLMPPPVLRGVITPHDDELSPEGRSFRQLSLSLTNLCSLACPDCYAGCQIPRKAQQLLRPEICELLKEAKELGGQTLRLTGGDVFLHSFFFARRDKERFPLLRLARAVGFDIIVLTDGSRLTDQICQSLKRLGASLLIKLWGPSLVQEALTGARGLFRPGDYREVGGLMIPQGLTCALRAGLQNTKPSSLGIQVMVTRENLAFVPRIYRWAREQRVVPFVELKMGSGTGQYLTTQALAALFEELRVVDNQLGFDWIPTAPVAGWSPCLRRYYGLVVQPDGQLTSCSATEPLGSIREGQTLRSVWESSEYEAYLKEVEALAPADDPRRWNAGCRCHCYLRHRDALAPYEFLLSGLDKKEKALP